MNKTIIGIQESIAQYQLWIENSFDLGELVMLYQHIAILKMFLEWFSF
jgi:hypothetical protein